MLMPVPYGTMFTSNFHPVGPAWRGVCWAVPKLTSCGWRCCTRLLDCSATIRAEHLLAAIALWDYCERSVLYVFGDAMGDPLADDLARLIRQAGERGITKTDISSVSHAERSRRQDESSVGAACGPWCRTFRQRANRRASHRAVVRWPGIVVETLKHGETNVRTANRVTILRSNPRS